MLSFLLLTIVGMVCLLTTEITIRVLHPEATRVNSVSRLKGEKNWWSRPDAEFHHVGEGLFHLNFPGSSDTAQARIMIVGD